MPTTPKAHFDEDIARALSIVNVADGLPAANDAERLVRDDVLRSAWMFAVGAMDAYFCDAYVAVLARTLRGKQLQPNINLPAFIRSIKIPIGSILASYTRRPNWRWRMAARQMLAKDNVLALDKVKKLFNPFFRDNQKLFGNVIDPWIALPGATAHLFGTTSAAYAAVAAGKPKKDARKTALKAMTRRLGKLIQRRHDCIHNCDRPKNAPRPVGNPGSVRNVIRDIRFSVSNCDAHIDTEFGLFLDRIGCNAATKNALGY
ncbi:MAG: hypothetical protein P4L84_34085 [Isosphaeraceae bacterium]|nr:hypothetical protein [Isosphaeraceae bacterium]